MLTRPSFLADIESAVGIAEHFARDLLDRLVGIAFFAGLDEVGVLGKAGSVEIEWNVKFLQHGMSRLDIFHRNGLTAGGVVRQGHETGGNFGGAFFADEIFELGHIHVALERDDANADREPRDKSSRLEFRPCASYWRGWYRNACC